MGLLVSEMVQLACFSQSRGFEGVVEVLLLSFAVKIKMIIALSSAVGIIQSYVHVMVLVQCLNGLPEYPGSQEQIVK